MKQIIKSWVLSMILLSFAGLNAMADSSKIKSNVLCFTVEKMHLQELILKVKFDEQADNITGYVIKRSHDNIDFVQFIDSPIDPVADGYIVIVDHLINNQVTFYELYTVDTLGLEVLVSKAVYDPSEPTIENPKSGRLEIDSYNSASLKSGKDPHAL